MIMKAGRIAAGIMSLVFASALTGCIGDPSVKAPAATEAVVTENREAAEVTTMDEQTKRRERSVQVCTSKGIKTNVGLPLLPAESKTAVRDMDTVCRRAVASLIVIQITFERIDNNKENIDFLIGELKRYGVENDLLPAEQRVVDGSCSQQDLINVQWEYECYWSLVWALGLIDDITDASGCCDCEKAIKLVSECESLDEFTKKCSMRSTAEILDMTDLYYCYHWATVEKRIRPETAAGDLDEEVVMERRRGLEWLISDEEDDWAEISLDT